MRLRPLTVLLSLGILLALILVVGIYAFLNTTTAIRVARNTTYLTEPLGEDGLPDYARAILDSQREGVTPENNGAIPFWQAMWPGVEFGPGQRGLLLEELGMEEPGTAFVPLEHDFDMQHRLVIALLQQRGYDELADAVAKERPLTNRSGYYAAGGGNGPVFDARNDALTLCREVGQPWTPEEFPLLADWIETNEESLDLLGVAAARPEFYSPSPSLLDDVDEPLINTLLPTVQNVRIAVRTLALRAYLRIGSGDFDAAWRDIQACYGLSDHIAGTAWLVEELVSIACKSIADHAALHLLNQVDLSDEMADKVFNVLNARPPRQNMAAIVDFGERISFLDMTLRLSQGKTAGFDDGDFPSAAAMVAFDGNVIMQLGNAQYDRAIASERESTWVQRQAVRNAFETGLRTQRPQPREMFGAVFSRKHRSQLVGEILVTLFIPAIQAAYASEDRDNARTELMRIAAALAVYRTTHGEYPEALDALVPEILDQAPTDFFHNLPFAYRKTNLGYLLYSFGPNGADDGGSNAMHSRFQGYAVIQEATSAYFSDVHRLLNDGSPNNAAGSSPVPFQIPPGADDVATRLPLPVRPFFPVDEDGASADDSE